MVSCKVSLRICPQKNLSDNCRLDETDGVVRPEKILNTMAQAILQAPDFDFYGQLRPPYGIILFYLYTSIVLVRMSSALKS